MKKSHYIIETIYLILATLSLVALGIYFAYFLIMG